MGLSRVSCNSASMKSRYTRNRNDYLGDYIEFPVSCQLPTSNLEIDLRDAVNFGKDKNCVK